jgi:hypothetical protein
MAQVEKADAKELRNFGLLLGAIIAALFAVWPLLRHREMRLWPWIVAAILWLGALIMPASLRYLHRGWTRLGHGLGWINTKVILTLLYAILVVPLGMAMRLFGRDPMARKFNPELESYRIESAPRPHKHMERPF